MSCFSLFFEFIGDHDVGAVNVVPDDFSSDDTSNDLAGVDTDSHVEFRKVIFFSHNLDVFNHREAHIDDVFGLLQDIPLIAIGKAQDNIAVANGINFVNIMFKALFIKLLKQFPEHFNNDIGFVLVFFGEGSKPFDISIEHGTVFELISELESVLNVLVFEFFVGVFGQELGHEVGLFLVALFVVDRLDVVVVALSQGEVLSEEHEGVVECFVQDGDFEHARDAHVDDGDCDGED